MLLIPQYSAYKKAVLISIFINQMLKHILFAFLLLSISTFDLNSTASYTKADIDHAQSLNLKISIVANTSSVNTSDTSNSTNLSVNNSTKQQVFDVVSASGGDSDQCDECSFFNVACFIFYGCNYSIKKFIFLVVVPLILILIIAYGFEEGCFTCSCFGRALMIISGVACILWLIQRRRKQKQQQKQEEKKEEPYKQSEKQECFHVQMDNPQTQNRLSAKSNTNQ